ncbi:LOW QUALITY PROTEIN: hypothetical protein PHMEG_00019840 [Phytophthora megakarya]|uniref:Uncharacterized protein n=1 Tax=Phytophthora megakarya TaxID=4795 RepID=A0A225VQM9_9STRA|nr:LOW QUALITY PROTEIN: hypothetical protein PHMEG_00019840 [Phytophthora megakarya]
MTLMLRKLKALSRLRTTVKVKQQPMEPLLEAISVDNKVEHIQVYIIKAVIDLLLVKVCDSVTIVVDGVSRNLSMDHAPPVETYYCIRRCKLCQQMHDACQCEAFNELAKILRTKVDKNDISPELQKIVFGGLGSLPTETGLDLIGQSQSAERVIDADCMYLRCNYPVEDNEYCMNTTGFEKERGISLGGGELDLETEVKITQDGDEYRWEKVAWPERWFWCIPRW